ncbi:reverse transcriptase domain-containing protein [Halopseudomonas sp. Lyrl_26]|uniref:reverse transcriptase domain-containing protein n=1 Tax=Halopseudomonas sp. Lyrl_26 TaxID=3110923 RepID=UPI003F823B14
MSKGDDWYRNRSYSHFDRPLQRDQAQRLVESPEAVTRHAFWPVIINPQKTVSIKKDKVKGGRIYVKKYRPIAFAAHSDSHIYSYYAKKLTDHLEITYEKLDGAPHVLAYRKFDPARNNIHFAYEAFEEIRKRGDCDVVALDVEGFFDSLNHNKLQQAWSNLLATQRLPDDHFAVYKACTRDSAITVPVLRELFGGEVRRRAGLEGRAICTPQTFRAVVKPRLRSRHEVAWEVKRKQPPSIRAGIPQGLPISAVLANVYMLRADNDILQRVRELGGSYRRYSDDILLVMPKGKGGDGERTVIEVLSSVCLSVQSNKTQRHRYLMSNEGLASFSLDENYNLGPCSAASYLGFSFDGRHIRVRDSTISRFMIKAKRAIERSRIAAEKSGSGYIKKRQLYARLTSLGYGSAYGDSIYEKLSDGVLPKGAPRLGFFKYLSFAKKIIKSEALDRQARQIESQVFQELNMAETLLNKKS